MEAAFFNVEGGFLEGIARGFKSGILTSSNYVNLSQCENLEGNYQQLVSQSVNQASHLFNNLLTFFTFLKHHYWIDFKLQLAATDYGNFLQNEPSPLATTTIAEKAREKLVADFKYLRANSNNPVSAFLDYLT